MFTFLDFENLYKLSNTVPVWYLKFSTIHISTYVVHPTFLPLITQSQSSYIWGNIY